MNPFRDTIVASPWEATRADIPEIHGQTYQECLRGLEQVRASNRSAALLIHGEAGSGKTHLLSRLRALLTPQAPIATDRVESLFVWVRLQTSPRMIWRTLRRTLVEDWFRPVAGGRPQIDRILYHRLAELRPAEWDLEPWYEYMLDEDPLGLKMLVEQIAVNLHLDRNTAVAFEHIAFGRFRRELRAWLAGTPLPDAVLERMELVLEDGTEEELEDQARQIVLMLCQLSGKDLPILLSFDQVEALQTTPGDEEALFAFGQLISTLHDSTKNVLLVSCVQSAFAAELKDHARSADYDRMTSLGAFSLDPLNPSQAELLIAGRLASTGETRDPPADRPPCWPIDPAEFRTMFSSGAVSARKLLSICAERFERPEDVTPVHESEPQSPEEKVDDFLNDRLQQETSRQLAMNSPDRTEEIVQHGLPLVMTLLRPDARLIHDEQLPDVSLIFEANQGLVGLSPCVQSNMSSLASRLKRLQSQLALKNLQRLVLLRDQRLPISSGAKKTQQYLSELEESGVVSVFPSQETLAALDALRKLLSDAKSGDLALNGTTITLESVGVWLQSHLPQSLRDLAGEVLAEPVS